MLIEDQKVAALLLIHTNRYDLCRFGVHLGNAG